MPTVNTARLELEKCISKARMTSYGLNAAIGAQVVLGSLTTALSAGISGGGVSLKFSCPVSVPIANHAPEGSYLNNCTW
jgi:hypothetical protein